MGAKVQFAFEFESHQGLPDVGVRIWVDKDRSESLADDEELTVQRDGLKFTAETKLTDNKTLGMAFRVTFVASPGDPWKLSVTSDAGKIFQDSAIMVRARDTLVDRFVK